VTACEPRIGDIGITKISGVGGLAIRAGQWLNGDGFADYEHAFVIVALEPGTGDVGTIVEAMPGGAVQVRNWHPDTMYLRCPDDGAIALHRFRIPTPHLKRYIKRSKSMICSQLADHAAMAGGWHLFRDNRWEGDVTPGDLERLYRAQGPA
jgi:hypothetical protein